MTDLGSLKADVCASIVCPRCSERNLLLKKVDSTTRVEDESVRTPESLVYNCEACNDDYVLHICSINFEGVKIEVVHWQYLKR